LLNGFFVFFWKLKWKFTIFKQIAIGYKDLALFLTSLCAPGTTVLAKLILLPKVIARTTPANNDPLLLVDGIIMNGYLYLADADKQFYELHSLFTLLDFKPPNMKRDIAKYKDQIKTVQIGFQQYLVGTMSFLIQFVSSNCSCLATDSLHPDNRKTILALINDLYSKEADVYVSKD
jgi:hypothetical protein